MNSEDIGKNLETQIIKKKTKLELLKDKEEQKDGRITLKNILEKRRIFIIVGDSGMGKSAFYNCLSNKLGIGMTA